MPKMEPERLIFFVGWVEVMAHPAFSLMTHLPRCLDGRVATAQTVEGAVKYRKQELALT